jgi:hypothetical protein
MLPWWPAAAPGIPMTVQTMGLRPFATSFWARTGAWICIASRWRRGCAVSFDTAQPHVVIARACRGFEAADFSCGHDVSQGVLTGELPSEEARHALGTEFHIHSSRVLALEDEQVWHSGAPACVCPDSLRWYPLAERHRGLFSWGCAGTPGRHSQGRTRQRIGLGVALARQPLQLDMLEELKQCTRLLGQGRQPCHGRSGRSAELVHHDTAVAVNDQGSGPVRLGLAKGGHQCPEFGFVVAALGRRQLGQGVMGAVGCDQDRPHAHATRVGHGAAVTVDDPGRNRC